MGASNESEWAPPMSRSDGAGIHLVEGRQQRIGLTAPAMHCLVVPEVRSMAPEMGWAGGASANCNHIQGS